MRARLRPRRQSVHERVQGRRTDRDEAPHANTSAYTASERAGYSEYHGRYVPLIYSAADSASLTGNADDDDRCPPVRADTRAYPNTHTRARAHRPAWPALQKAQHRATQTKGVGYSHVGRTQSTPSGTGWAVRGVLLLSTLYTWLAKCKPGSAGGRGRLKAAYLTCKADEGVDIFGLNTYRWCRYAHGNAQAHSIQCTARAPCRWCG